MKDRSNLNFIDQPQNSTPAPSPPKHEEDLSKFLANVIHLMPPSYYEQSKRPLTYLAENEHVQIDKKRVMLESMARVTI